MSKGFIKKNWQKDASTVLISTGIRGGSAIATAWGCKKISDASKSTTVHNLVGPGFLLLGTLGDMMIENDYLKAACQGISTYGMLYTISTIASDSVAPAIGMNGINDTAELFSGVGALGETTSVNYTVCFGKRSEGYRQRRQDLQQRLELLGGKHRLCRPNHKER